VQADIGMSGADLRPFCIGLLDAAFAEITLPGGDQRLDVPGGAALGDSD